MLQIDSFISSNINLKLKVHTKPVDDIKCELLINMLKMLTVLELFWSKRLTTYWFGVTSIGAKQCWQPLLIIFKLEGLLFSHHELTSIFDVYDWNGAVVYIALNIVLLCAGGIFEWTLCNRFFSAGFRVKSDVFASLPYILPLLWEL